MINAAESRRDLHVGFALVLAVLTVWATALPGEFVYDDLHSVAANPAIQSLANVPRFFVDPQAFSVTGAMYRPVLLCTFAVDHALGGGSPLPFKLGNVLLHAACAWLLFALARRHGAARAPAAAAGLLFAVHPVASEAINFVSARSEGLMLGGMLLALYAHARVLAGDRWRLGIVVGAVVACGSKETGVVLPALLLAQEWLWPRADGGAAGPWRRWREVAARLWPAVLVVVVYLLARKLLLGQATTTLLGRGGADPLFGHGRDLLTQLATMGLLLPRALLLLAAPVQLSIDHPVHYQQTFWSLPVLAGWAAVAALLWLGLHRGRRAPAATLGTLLAAATALPWVVVPLNTPLAEHRLYGPLAGLALALAHLLARLLPRAAAVGESRRWRRAPVAAFAAVAVAFAVGAAARSLDYGSELQLWRAAVAVAKDSYRAHWGLGTQLLLTGDRRGAEAELARAWVLYPAFPATRQSWVDAMLGLPIDEGWPYRAQVVAEDLVRQQPDNPYYRHQLANVLLQVGIDRGDRATIERAEAESQACLQLGPPKALVFRLMAECRRRLGDADGALRHLDRALELGLDFPGLRAERSQVLRQLGRAGEADRELREAFRRAPMDAAVRAAWHERYAAPPR